MGHLTKSGVNSTLVRRLQKATEVSYTKALRTLEAIPVAERMAFVIESEKKDDNDSVQ